MLCSGNSASAQYFYDKNYYNTPLIFELGGSVGIMNSLTDIGGTKGFGGKFTKDLNLGNNEFNAGLYFGALYNSSIGVRIEAKLKNSSSGEEDERRSITTSVGTL